MNPDPVDTYLEKHHKSRTLVPFSRKRPSQAPSQHRFSFESRPIQQDTVISKSQTENKEQQSRESDPTKKDSQKAASSAFVDVEPDQKESLNQSQTLEDLEAGSSSNGTPLVDMPPDETSWIPPHKRRRMERQKKKEEAAEGGKNEITRKVTCGMSIC